MQRPLQLEKSTPQERNNPSLKKTFSTKCYNTHMSDEDIKKKLFALEKRVIKIEKFLLDLSLFSEMDDTEEVNIDAVDDLYDKAVFITIPNEMISASFLQRRLQIGFNRACRILEQLEQNGIVSSEDGSKPRKVLIKKEDLESLKEKLEKKFNDAKEEKKKN